MTRDPHAWTDEARSGLATERGKLGTVSRRSDIDRAAIPDPAVEHTARTPEDEAADTERLIAERRRLCSDLGVTPGELQRLAGEGRLRPCEGCKRLGIFDRRGEAGFQHLCRRCRKGKR